MTGPFRIERTKNWKSWKAEQDGRPNEELTDLHIETMNSQVRVLVQDFMPTCTAGAELLKQKQGKSPQSWKVAYGSNPKTI
jgi:hypothetical protein